MFDNNKLNDLSLKAFNTGQSNKQKPSSSPGLLDQKTIENLTKQLSGLFNKLGEIREQMQDVKPSDDASKDNSQVSPEMQQTLDSYNQAAMMSKFANTMNKFNTFDRLKEGENIIMGAIKDVFGKLGKNDDVDSTDSSPPVVSSSDSAPLEKPETSQGNESSGGTNNGSEDFEGQNGGFGPPEFKFENSQDKEHIENEMLENGVKEAGGEILPSNKNQVSQFAGLSNINGISKELGINGNCAPCALTSAARALDVIQGDETTAQDDVANVREKMKPGSNHFQGTKPADIARGARKMGMSARMFKGNTDDIIKELDKGNKAIVSVNAKEYGVFKKKKEKVGHAVTVTDYDPKKDAFVVNDSLMDKPILVKRENLERAMRSSSSKNTIISLSKEDKSSSVADSKESSPHKKALHKSHTSSKPSGDGSPTSDSSSKSLDKSSEGEPIDLGTKEGPSLSPTYDPRKTFPRMIESDAVSAAGKSRSKDPSMTLKGGARISEQDDINHVSQYKNSANPNSDSPNNANSAPASLVTASRKLGRLDNSGGSSTVNSQIKSARGLMNPGSDDYTGNHPRHVLNGSKKMGLYSMPTKGNSKNIINVMKDKMKNGDQVMAFVNSNAYSQGAPDNAHTVVVKGFESRYKEYDPSASPEENHDAYTPKEYAIVHDPRFEKPIEMPVEKLQEAMNTVPINGFKNTFVRLNKDPLKLDGPLIVVGDTIVRDTEGKISPKLQKELNLKRSE